MKQLYLLWIGALVCLIGLLSAPSFAQQVLYVKNTQVYLRSSPTSTEDNVLTTLTKDTPVTLIQKRGVWYNIRLSDGREGWISKWVLESRGSKPGKTPDPSPSRRLPQPEKEPDLPAPSLVDEDMVLIPGETAIIGSDRNDLDRIVKTWNVERDMLMDETPKHMLSIRGFYLDRYEVTNAQYKQFVEATRYPPPPHWLGGTYPENTGNHPVTFVSWEDAQAYAQWAGKRLPTAEEWELAARGTDGQMFPWGNSLDLPAVNIHNPEQGVAAVGSYAQDVSPYQIYDLGGNVMEWTLTPYGEEKDFFVLKGSAWNGQPFEARCANNTPAYAEYRLEHVGFRCARSETD